MTYRYEYTKGGRLKEKFANRAPVLADQDDKNGNVKSICHGDGTIAQYQYDVMDWITRVSRSREGREQQELAGYRYNLAGQMEEIFYGNGMKTRYHYTESGQMSQLAVTNGDRRVILNYGYLYDGNGNLTEKSGEPYQNRYRYDFMNRLEEVVYDQRGAEWYRYALAENRELYV